MACQGKFSPSEMLQIRSLTLPLQSPDETTADWPALQGLVKLHGTAKEDCCLQKKTKNCYCVLFSGLGRNSSVNHMFISFIMAGERVTVILFGFWDFSGEIDFVLKFMDQLLVVL